MCIENAEEGSQSISALSPRVWEKDPEEKTGKGAAGSNARGQQGATQVWGEIPQSGETCKLWGES